MEATEGDQFEVSVGTIRHLEEFIAERIVARTANGPWLGFGEIDKDEEEFRGALDDGSAEFVGRCGPGHHMNVGAASFFEKSTFRERPYFSESDPKLLVHGWVPGEPGT